MLCEPCLLELPPLFPSLVKRNTVPKLRSCMSAVFLMLITCVQLYGSLLTVETVVRVGFIQSRNKRIYCMTGLTVYAEVW